MVVGGQSQNPGPVTRGHQWGGESVSSPFPRGSGCSWLIPHGRAPASPGRALVRLHPGGWRCPGPSPACSGQARFSRLTAGRELLVRKEPVCCSGHARQDRAIRQGASVSGYESRCRAPSRSNPVTSAPRLTLDPLGHLWQLPRGDERAGGTGGGPVSAPLPAARALGPACCLSPSPPAPVRAARGSPWPGVEASRFCKTRPRVGADPRAAHQLQSWAKASGRSLLAGKVPKASEDTLTPANT